MMKKFLLFVLKMPAMAVLSLIFISLTVFVFVAVLFAAIVLTPICIAAIMLYLSYLAIKALKMPDFR